MTTRPASRLAALLGLLVSLHASAAYGQEPTDAGAARPETTPNTNQPAPNTNQPAPNTNQPAPNTNQPAPNTNQPAPNANQPAPNANQPAPNANQPAPPPKGAAADADQKTDQQKRIEELEARLEETQHSVAQIEARQEESKIRMYGFSDVAFRKMFLRDASHYKNIIGDRSSFLLGSLNYYFEAQPHPRFRALTEVRFALYPNGTFDERFQPIDTSTFDVTSATGRNKVQWSGIVIERAFLEAKIFDALKVQAGYFLTPYGIWNVDHGSPTLIASALPGFFAGEYFPTRLTGIQALGNVSVGDVELGYRAYLTNGRNRPLIDNRDGKLVGARGFATVHLKNTDFTLGGSAFAGRLEKQELSIAVVPQFRVNADTTVAYDEWGAGGDFSLDHGPFRMRAEFVMNRINYDPGKAEPYSIPGTFYMSRTRWDAYGLAAYQLPWLGLEPYAYVERDYRPEYFSDFVTILSPGLNIHLNASCQIKNQFMLVKFNRGGERDDFQMIDTRFVIAY